MEYKSNLNEVLNRLKSNLLSTEAQDKLFLKCAQVTYASNMRRVFNQGLNVNMKVIGHYSTKPIYINPKISNKSFSPIGKKGKIGKTRYFPGGYKQFKSVIGLGTRVNLTLTSGLMNNFQMLKVKGGYQIGFLSSKYAKISDGLEKKYGSQIFGLSYVDRKIIDEVVKNFLKNNK